MPYRKVKMVHGVPAVQPYNYTATMKPNYTKQATMKPNYINQATMKPNYINQATMVNSLDYRMGPAFTGVKYKYIPNKKEINKDSMFIDYNDPTQLNSAADIILSTFNKNMQHSKLLGVNWANMPMLNIIPNTLEYMYKYVARPIFKGQGSERILAPLYNTLMNVGETLGVLGNPVKAAIITGFKGGDLLDIADAVTKATIGDSTGRHNYDYDTGYKLLDIALEIVSDPLNWITFGGKTATTVGVEGITSAANQADDVARTLSKIIANSTDNIVINNSDDIARVIYTGVKNGTINNIDDVAKTLTPMLKPSHTIDEILDIFRNQKFQDALRDTLFNTFYKNNKTLGVISTRWNRSHYLNRLLKTPTISQSISQFFNKTNDVGNDFIKEFFKQLKSKGFNASQIKTLASKQLNIDLLKQISDYIATGKLNDLNFTIIGNSISLPDFLRHFGNYYSKILTEEATKSALVKGGLLAISAEKKTSGFLLKTALSVAGIYPLYQGGKYISKQIKNVYTNRIINTATKANNVRPTNFLTEGTNVTSSVKQDVDLVNLANNAKEIDPGIMSYAISHTLAQDFNVIRPILARTDLTAIQKYNMTLEQLSKLTPNGFKNIDETIEFIDALDTQFKQTTGAESSGFLQYKTELQGIQDSLDSAIESDTLQLIYKSKTPEITRAKQFTSLVDNLEKYKMAPRTLRTLVKQTAINQFLNPEIVNMLSYNNLDRTINILNYINKQLKPFKSNPDISGITSNIDEINTLVKTNANPQLIKTSIDALVSTINYMAKQQYKFFKESKIQQLNPELYDLFFTQTENGLTIFNENAYTDLLNIANKKLEDLKLTNNYKQAQLTNQRAIALEQQIDSFKKHSISLSQGPSMARSDLIKDRLELQDKFRKASVNPHLNMQYNQPEIIEYTKQLVEKDQLCSTVSIIRLNNALDILQDAGEMTGLIYDYNVGMFEDLKQHYRYLTVLLNTMANLKDQKQYSYLYKKLHKQHTLVMSDIHRIEKAIGAKSVWRDENIGLDPDKLSGIESNRPRFLDITEKELPFEGATIKVYNKDGTIQNEWIYHYPELLPNYYVPETIGESWEFLRKIETELSYIDFHYIEKMLLTKQDTVDYYFTQFDKAFVQASLNDAWLQANTNEHFISLCANVQNKDLPIFKEFYKPFSEDSIRYFFLHELVTRDIKLKNEMLKRIRAYEDSLAPEERPKYGYISTALETTLPYIAPRDFDYVANHLPDVMNELIYKMQGYIRSNDPYLKSQKLDNLMKKYNITPDKIINGLIEMGLDPKDYERHTSMWDTVAQQLTMEAIAGVDSLPGYQWDMEGTGLINVNGYSNSKITQITMIRRTPDGKLVKIFDGKIRIPREEAVAYYGISQSALIKMQENGTSSKTGAELEKEYFDSITVKPGETIYTEKQMISDFLDILREIPSYENIYGFNSTEYDLVLLQNRVKSSDINLNHQLTARSKTRKIQGRLLKNTQQYEKLSIDTIIKTKQFKDFYQEISSDNYMISPKIRSGLQAIIDDYIESYKQQVLPLALAIGKRPKFIEEVGHDILTEFHQYLDINAMINRFGETLPSGESMTELTVNPGTEIGIEAEQEIADMFRRNKDAQKLCRATLDNQVVDDIAKNYIAITDVLRDTGAFGKYGRQNPIPSNLFALNTQTSINTVIDAMEYMRDTLKKYSPKHSQDINNLLKKYQETKDPQYLLKYFTQFLTIGMGRTPIFAYKSASYTTDYILDTPELTIQEKSKASDFAKSIENKYISLYNTELIIPYEKEIKDFLTEIKNSAIYDELKYVPLDLENIPYNFAILETAWAGIKSRASMGIDTKYQAEIFINKMKNKYPELIKIIDEGQAHVRPNLTENNKYIGLKMPDYYHSQQAIEYTQALALRQEITNTINSFKILHDDKYVPLDNVKEPITLAEQTKDLNDTYINTFDKNGQKTGLTERMDKVAGLMANNKADWRTNQLLQLTPEQWFNYLVNEVGPSHTQIIYAPKKNTFNNLTLFANFATTKKDLQTLGIDWTWDEENRIIILKPNDEILKHIKLNKNVNLRHTHYDINGNLIWGHTYVYDGEELPRVILQEMPTDLLKEQLQYDKQLKPVQEFIDKMIANRSKQIEYDPEMIGTLGITNSLNDIKEVENEPLYKSKFNIFGTDEVEMNNYPYMKHIAGELDDLQKGIGYISSNYMNTLIAGSIRKFRYTKDYYDYIMWIMNQGIDLATNEWYFPENITDVEIAEQLEKDPEMVAVYLKPNKYAKGAYELKRLNLFTEAGVKYAKKMGAKIIPYDVYTSAVSKINQFSYSNESIRLYNAYLSLQKRAWLFHIPFFINNAVDSTMKNIMEMGTVDTAKYIVLAATRYPKYLSDLQNIMKLNPMGDLTLKGIMEFYDSKNPLAKLTKDEFMDIYDSQEYNGMNTLSTLTDGIFGIFMKPNEYIERISRYALWLESKDYGYTKAQTAKRIDDTHFNYDTASYAEFVAKMVFPFYTFVSKSIVWFLDMIENRPGFLRNLFNIYRPIWDIQNIEHDEIEGNTSLLYQIILGRIPLKVFGYKDKEITKIVNTKYGPKKVKVTNTATLNIAPSIFDVMQLFSNPLNWIKEKLAPPFQVMADTVTRFVQDSYNNTVNEQVADYESTSAYYRQHFGDTSMQYLSKHPEQILDLIPVIGQIRQRILNNKTYERTENKFLANSLGIFGATSRWGEFEEPKYKEYKYPKRYYSGYSNIRKYIPGTSRRYTRRFYAKKFYPRRPMPSRTMVGREIYYPRSTSRYYSTGKTPYSSYTKALYRAAYPNRVHNPSTVYRGNLPKLQSIPQYLHSYNGLTRQGKSKLLSWMHMNTRYKVKNTLKRQARAKSFYNMF